MEALKRKWNSNRGASILLALLFLLICVMAGASVVMAASSNAGKIRSNREEQQKYLTLISALNLLCDELQSVEYMGCYRITKEGPVEDPDRVKLVDSSGTTYYTNTYYTYTQLTGKFKQRTDSNYKLILDDGDMSLLNLLALSDVWDSIFAEQFIVKDDNGTYKKEDGKYVMKESTNKIKKDWEIYKYDTSTIPYFDNSEAKEYKLRFQVTGSGISDGFEEPVTISVIGLNENGTIILRASLKDMEVRATLEPNVTKPNGLELLDTAKLKDIRYKEIVDENGNTHYIYEDGETDPVRWELVAIEKVEKREE